METRDENEGLVFIMPSPEDVNVHKKLVIAEMMNRRRSRQMKEIARALKLYELAACPTHELHEAILAQIDRLTSINARRIGSISRLPKPKA